MTKIDRPIIEAAAAVAPPFSLSLRSQRATKADASAYGKYIAKTTKPENTPAVYSDLAYAALMIKEAMAALKPEVTKQVRKGNAENPHGVKLTVAIGRTSVDFSGIPEYDKAAERAQAAKEKVKALEVKLAAKGKGKVKQAPPMLRASVS